MKRILRFPALVATAGCLVLAAPGVSLAHIGSVSHTVTAATTTGTSTSPTTGMTTTTVSALDASSDMAALTAYRAYLQALVGGTRQSQQLDQTFVSSSSQTCQGALTRVNSLSRDEVSGPALKAFGQEIGSDLWLAFNSGSVKALNQLATTLQPLTWSESSATQTVTAFIRAERGLVTLAPSNLCGDAFMLADKPTVEPVATSTFLKRYMGARAILNSRLAAFLGLLERYQTPAAARLVAAIDRIAGQFASLSVTAQQASANTLLTSLGL